MEDHREAYFFWKKLGLSDCTCVHVDAHLDACGFKVPGYTGMQQPEVNCGNYLLPAMAEDIVQALVWVVPPHLKKEQDLLTWAREELQRWLHPTVAEYLSLQGRNGRIEGELKGRRFVVCESDNLPELEGPVLLDIDVDYYLGPQDEVWQTPLQLADQLGGLRPVALTVAISVQGGYTPLWLRYLGELSRLAFQEPEEAARAWADLHGKAEHLPDWLRAARLAAGAGSDYDHPAYLEAAAIDPAYAIQPLDAACFYLERKRFDRCYRWLEHLATEDPTAAAYLQGFAAFRREHYGTSLESWRSVLEEPHDKLTRGHLLEMVGRAQAALGRAGEAVGSFLQAIRLDSRDVSLWLELARSQAQAGRKEEAARSYRRGITLGPDLLMTAQAQLELAQLYADLGQASLAQAQRTRLLKQRLPAVLRMQAEVLAVTAARRQG